MFLSENHSRQSRDIQEQEFNSIFISQQILELGFAEELNHISDAKHENHQRKRNHARQLRSKQRWTSTTRSTLWTWKARKRRNLKFYRTLNDCVICFDTECSKKVCHIRDSECWSQDSRFSCTQC